MLAPRRFVEARIPRFGAHVFRRREHGNEDADFGLFAFADAAYEARNGSKKKARDLLDKVRAIDADYVARLLDPTGPFWNLSFEKLLPPANAP